MTAMTQEEIVAAVRTVAQGLEALRSEHTGILHGLQEAPDPVANERAGLVQQSAEMIELGLGEAQVGNGLIKINKKWNVVYEYAIDLFLRKAGIWKFRVHFVEICWFKLPSSEF